MLGERYENKFLANQTSVITRYVGVIEVKSWSIILGRETYKVEGTGRNLFQNILFEVFCFIVRLELLLFIVSYFESER